MECSHFNLQYVTSDDNGRIQKITKLNNGKYDISIGSKMKYISLLQEELKKTLKKRYLNLL